MKKLALSLALALAASGAFAKDWSTVRFGVDASYAPFESKASDGKRGRDAASGNSKAHYNYMGLLRGHCNPMI